MFDLNNCSNKELVILAGILSISLAENLTSEETGRLAALLTTIGDNLALLAIDKAVIENNNFNDKKKDDTLC
ncbi:MAG: hypothetical protein ACLU8F_05245 [Clostridia bacterium]